MAESLRDQLLRIGIANEAHAKRADEKPAKPQKPKAKAAAKTVRKPAKKAPKPTAKASKKALPAAEDPAVLAKKREVKAAVKTLIEANNIADFRGESPFYYRIGERIRQILLTETVRDGVVAGELVITRLNRATYILNSETAAKVLALNDQWLIIRHEPGEAQPNPEDDPYAGFEIPDDLIW